ncbi:MAG: response regulator transcription factor [SAR324 cluster bacterium]|nr:response regulator transcription factor [SAR324 cluster bacterium]
MTIKLLLADDHDMIRQSMTRMTGKMADVEIIGEASNGQEAIDMAREKSPDVIFMDIMMPGMNGIEATREILKDQPDIKVIALTSHTQAEMIQDMFQAGALGFLGKNCRSSELTQAVTSVMANRYYVAGALTGEVIENFIIVNKPKITAVSDDLTQREREVLRLIAEGFSSKEIANKLSISAKTIGAHRENLMKKLNLHNVASLTRYAIQRGLIDLG